MSLYEIAFSGALVPGAALEQVKANLARLFQADEKRIEALFSGRRVVIKTGLDAASAEKYRATLERAGAMIEVRSLAAEVEEVELAPPPSIAPAPAPAPAQVVTPSSVAKVVPRDEYMAAFTHVQAPDFGIAPVGQDLQDEKQQVQAKELDLSAFSLAPVGSDMGEIPRSQEAPVVDISHLSLK